jgi:putative transcriptional regulator
MSRVTLRLPELRAKKRLSQRQLSALAGVRPDTVSALERGKSYGIRFETLARLCDALGCEPGELFEIEHDSDEAPVLGGPDEDELLRQRLADPGRVIDGPSFVRELLGETGHFRRRAG